MTFTTTTRLKKLSESTQFDVAGDSHDIRGWSVVDEHGTELGKVEDLLYDTDTEQVRYVIVECYGRFVLLPLGVLGFEHEPRRVVAIGYAQDRLKGLAPYVGGLVNEEVERAYYLASVPGHKDDDPLDYGIPTFQGGVPKRAEQTMLKDNEI